MFCTNCGTYINDGMKFCSQCGTPVYRKPPKKNPRKGVAIAAAICILLFGVVASVFYFHEKRSGSVVKKVENQTTFETGDIIYHPTRDALKTVDAVGNSIEYYQNLLYVYTFDQLSNHDKQKLAKELRGEIVGDISGSINVMQIQFEAADLEELNLLAQEAMKNPDVLYASYDAPMRISETDDC